MTNSLLWKIKKDGYPESFLFGTIHIYDSDVFQIPDTIFNLIDSVEIYMPEADNREVPYLEMLKLITVNDPEYSLKKYLSDESYAKILGISKIKEDILNKYKPFFAFAIILTDDDMPNRSIDSDLLNYAMRAKKIVDGLESFEDQINAVDNIPFEDQAGIIESAISSLDKRNDFNKLMNNYKEQNLQALTDNLAAMNPVEIFINSIQKNRNIVMSDKIDLLLSKGYSLFVAVGALHLPDTEKVKGIVSILRNKGYMVEAVDFSFTF
ncbi:MAG: TraB/GumN family protein [Prevotellaceae bacterium]|jgi:uncharacterized protein YbaP (TraB family)|nr:TraB/GumN family protein [Prevotellaceae bacterium]